MPPRPPDTDQNWADLGQVLARLFRTTRSLLQYRDGGTALEIGAPAVLRSAAPTVHVAERLAHVSSPTMEPDPGDPDVNGEPRALLALAHPDGRISLHPLPTEGGLALDAEGTWHFATLHCVLPQDWSLNPVTRRRLLLDWLLDPSDQRAWTSVQVGAGPITTPVFQNLSRPQALAEVLATYPPKSAVLVLDLEPRPAWQVGQGDADLTAVLVDSEGVAFTGSYEVSSSELADQIRDLRAVSGGRAASRAVRDIGVSVIDPLPLQQAIADTILPSDLVEALQPVEHLVVLGEASLGNIPFAMLHLPGDEQPLIHHMSICIAPDYLALFERLEAWSGHFDNPLVVGNPAMPEPYLASLEGAEDEALAVGSVVGVEPLVGAAATETIVAARAATADLVYLATHGVADDDDGLNSRIALAPGDSTQQEGWWTAAEIQAEDWPRARLAVLSACQTGAGQAVPGGVVGLARALQLAGAPRVTVSLWEVDDQATAALMSAFARSWAEHPPAQALRLAMLQLQAHPKWSAPHYWAAFTLFGTPR